MQSGSIRVSGLLLFDYFSYNPAVVNDAIKTGDTTILSVGLNSVTCLTCQSNFTCLLGWTILGSEGSCYCYFPSSPELFLSYADSSEYCLSLGSRLMVGKNKSFN